MAAIKELLPGEEYFYIADSENCPYGEKTDDELYKIVRVNVEKLRDWGAQIVVVACNTATTRCIVKLRKDYPDLKFVGTEPAIKLATDTDAEKILVLATPGTVKSERMGTLIKENVKSGQTMEIVACPGLADTIEQNLDTQPEKITRKLEELLTGVGEFDVIVLGCTHYSLVKEQLQRFFQAARIIDGNKGVAQEVANIAQTIR